MHRVFLTLALVAFSACLLLASAISAQLVGPASKSAHVRIIKGPAPELARADLTIIRWTTNNPGGSPEHFGVVHYGTDPKDLSRTAKSHIRLNQAHTYTVFRVRLDDLAPKTRYYYTVDSADARGTSDRVPSQVRAFTTE